MPTDADRKRVHEISELGCRLMKGTTIAYLITVALTDDGFCTSSNICCTKHLKMALGHVADTLDEDQKVSETEVILYDH